MNDLESLLFQLIGGRNKDNIINEISNSVNDVKVRNTKKDLDLKQNQFLMQYEKMSNYLYFSSAGILNRVGYDLDQYMTLDLRKKEELGKKYNLLAPNKLNDILIQAGYSYDQVIKNEALKEQVIGSDKYFKDEIALRDYLTAYKNFIIAIQNGYNVLIEAGQNLNGTESFQYVVGFLNSKDLENILVINKEQLSNITSKLKFFGIDIKDAGQIEFKFNETIRKKEAREQIAKELQNSVESTIIKGDKSITKQALINSFESLKDMNIIKEKNNIKKTSTINNEENDSQKKEKNISKEEKLKILLDEDISDQIIKNNQQNLFSLNNLFEKQEKDKIALKNTGNTINLDFNTLSQGLEVLSNPKKMVDDAINEHVPIFQNLNRQSIKETKETYNKIQKDLDQQAAQFVQAALNKKN